VVAALAVIHHGGNTNAGAVVGQQRIVLHPVIGGKPEAVGACCVVRDDLSTVVLAVKYDNLITRGTTRLVVGSERHAVTPRVQTRQDQDRAFAGVFIFQQGVAIGKVNSLAQGELAAGVIFGIPDIVRTGMIEAVGNPPLAVRGDG